MTNGNVTCRTATNGESAAKEYRPSVDIVETGEEFQIFADIPGALQDSIDLCIEDGTLTVHAKVA